MLHAISAWAPWTAALAILLASLNPEDDARARHDGGTDPRSRPATSSLEANDVSPVRGIRRSDAFRPPRLERPRRDDVRTIDGTDNNPFEPTMGAAGSQLVRRLPADYADGVSTMAGEDRPSARAVSNAVCAQDGPVPNRFRSSDFLWQWGQFLDHDIDLTDGADPPEPRPIAVPTGDPWFDPEGTGEATIAFNRSVHDVASGTGAGDQRQQLNEITAWIDASNVYGSDEERALALRTLDGSGRLRMSEGRLLPFNTDGLPNAGGPSPELFLAGDVRANEQVGLTALHVLFVREHDRLAREIREREPHLAGDEIFERARRIVGAQMQVITYREYLPALLGPDALRPYRGYSPGVEAGIRNVFSTAAYRYGHSALSATLLRLDARGNEIPEGHLALRDAFFAPHRLTDEGGIEPILRGLAAQVCQAVDPLLVDDVRNFLFGPPGSGGFDLAALNLQRGRDHGLPSYNDARRELGLEPARSFGDITSRPGLAERLAAAYDHVEDVDIWAGGLAEDPVPGSQLGRLFHRIVRDQFEALRDGDRFWYQLVLSGPELEEVERTRLSDVIRRNTRIAAELPDDVFRVASEGGEPPRRR